MRLRVILCLLALSRSTAIEVSVDGATKERFTDELARDVGEVWHKVVNHRFTDALAAGTLDKDILQCYLIQDHRFLDAFVVLLSSMIAHARSLEDRIPGAQFLGLITGKENTYFERSFEALGVSSHERNTTPDASATKGFQAVMRDAAASGSLAEMLAVLVVAEWSYQSWGERVLPKAVEGPFYYREWVDLHSGPYFGSVVEYLRGLLDKEASRLSETQLTFVRARFAAATHLELEFFDACYEHPLQAP